MTEVKKTKDTRENEFIIDDLKIGTILIVRKNAKKLSSIYIFYIFLQRET